MEYVPGPRWRSWRARTACPPRTRCPSSPRWPTRSARRTRPGSCTAMSNPPTSSSPTVVTPSSPTSGSPAPRATTTLHQDRLLHRHHGLPRAGDPGRWGGDAGQRRVGARRHALRDDRGPARLRRETTMPMLMARIVMGPGPEPLGDPRLRPLGGPHARAGPGPAPHHRRGGRGSAGAGAAPGGRGGRGGVAAAPAGPDTGAGAAPDEPGPSPGGPARSKARTGGALAAPELSSATVVDPPRARPAHPGRTRPAPGQDPRPGVAGRGGTRLRDVIGTAVALTNRAAVPDRSPEGSDLRSSRRPRGSPAARTTAAATTARRRRRRCRPPHPRPSAGALLRR